MKLPKNQGGINSIDIQLKCQSIQCQCIVSAINQFIYIKQQQPWNQIIYNQLKHLQSKINHCWLLSTSIDHSRKYKCWVVDCLKYWTLTHPKLNKQLFKQFTISGFPRDFPIISACNNQLSIQVIKQINKFNIYNIQKLHSHFNKCISVK